MHHNERDPEQLLTIDTTILDTVPLERLEAEISGFASRIAAATARWLLWIAAYDRRRGWETWEAKSCAHWLNWQCGVSPRTAREHVQIAHTIAAFAELRETFLAGELSYSKVRAISRVIDDGNEAELIDLGRRATASQLERILGKMPAAGDTNDDDPETVIDEVHFTNNGNGTMTMMLTRPIAEMAAARKMIHRATDRVIARQQADGQTKTEVIERLGGINALRADTATALITGTLNAPQGVTSTVLVVADIDALTTGSETTDAPRVVDGPNSGTAVPSASGIADDTTDHPDDIQTHRSVGAESTVESKRVHPAVVQRLCCDSIIQTALIDGNNNEQAIGSEHRIVPRRIRRLLERRDHAMCQFPGCESEHRLHAHHVIHWTHGGPTELPNLILLCHFHHHSVHEGGWNITADDSSIGRDTRTGRWTFHDPTGRQHHVPILRLPTTKPLPNTPAIPFPGTAAPLAGTGERANLDYIADVLIANQT